MSTLEVRQQSDGHERVQPILTYSESQSNILIPRGAASYFQRGASILAETDAPVRARTANYAHNSSSYTKRAENCRKGERETASAVQRGVYPGKGKPQTSPRRP